MTDEPRSRFAEPVEWETPEAFYRRIVTAWDKATPDERRLLHSAAGRIAFAHCTLDEQRALLRAEARTHL
jgi:hypothetical protein